MTKNTLASFETIPYFTIQGFRQVTKLESLHSARIMLHRWAQAGHIVALKKGVYMTRRFYEAHRQEPTFSQAVSAIIYPHSYVSLEYVLQQNGLLTEVTYPVTAVTTGNTHVVTNAIGTFWYRSIRPGLYAGYSILEYFGIRYAVASLPKALFDYLYLRPIPPASRGLKIDLAEELRLNLDEMGVGDRKEFTRLASNSGSRKMKSIAENFRRHIWLT
jgi:hypothetical protein